jgi:hypothetical protein
MANKSKISDPAAEVVEAAVPMAAAEPPARKVYSIVKYGDPVLEKPGAAIRNFDAELEALAEDMFASMYAAQGVGLAAPQIGKSIRLAVVDVTTGKNPEAKIVLVNPEIIHAEGEVREEEGCLSIPISWVRNAPHLSPCGHRTQKAKHSRFEERICRRVLPRNRPLERRFVLDTSQHAGARFDQAKDQEGAKRASGALHPSG